MLTADTITDEQMLDMYDRRELSARDFTLAACRRGSIRYTHESNEAYATRMDAGERIRARCAEILNARAEVKP
jgi:hypothetical protein